MDTDRRFGTHLMFLALLLVGFALRLFRLDAQSIWWDEGISLHLGTSSLAHIVADRLNNIHPPLYFFLLKVWLWLVGVSPFTGRYLSVMAALLQIPLAFAAAKLISRRIPVAWIAAGLVALSPLSVIYGQEIRVYAMLPVVFLGLIILAERLIIHNDRSGRVLLGIGLLEWLALHLHYIALFGVATIGLWGLLRFARGRERSALWRWIGLHSIVGLACLPWFVPVALNWGAVEAEAGAGTFGAAEVPLRFLFAQVWAFHLTGLAGALADPFVRVVAATAAALLSALLVLRVLFGSARRGYLLRTLALWAVPLLSALVVWSVRSFSHPRYVVIYTAAFFLLAAMLILPARRRAEQLLAAAFALCLLLLAGWGLRQYFFMPGASKPDMRGVARYLEDVAGPADIIFIPDTDWSLPFEYQGSTPIRMPGFEGVAPDSIGLDEVLRCPTAESEPTLPCVPAARAFIVDYDTGTRDWQRRLPFELEVRGSLIRTDSFDDLSVREYLLESSVQLPPSCDPSQTVARFGSLRLVSAWLEQGSAANTAAAASLCWIVDGPPAERLTTSLLLQDATGEHLAQTDTLLLDAIGRPSDQWSAGRIVRTYHLLPLPVGTPPLAYDLFAGVYARDGDVLRPIEATSPDGAAGQTVPLGRVVLGRATNAAANPYDAGGPPLLPNPIEMAPGLELISAGFRSGPYRPGETVRARLAWRANQAPLPALRPRLQLEQAGRVLAVAEQAPAQGRYPTTEWVSGETVAEVRDMRVPAGASGTMSLVLAVGDGRHLLGDLEVNGQAVEFDPPAAAYVTDAVFGATAQLVGFDLPSLSVSVDRPIPLTLYWQSLTDNAPADYTVFAHLLDADGRLIAQHDGPPAAGARPTGDWLMGEYVADLHPLDWRELTYTGPATVAVGFYEPVSGQRVPLANGGDALMLPVVVRVEPAAP